MAGEIEAPEDPEAVKWLRWAYHHFVREGQVIKQAPFAFILAIAGVGSFIFFGLQWHHAGETAVKDATLENQRSHIAVLEEEVKGVQPQQATINVKRKKIVEQLQAFYVESGPLKNTEIPKTAPIEQFNSYKNAIQAWADKVGHWINDNMGEAAKEKFYDDSSGMFLMYGNAYNDEDNRYKNFITRLRRNLSTLIETNAWDRSSDAQ